MWSQKSHLTHFNYIHANNYIYPVLILHFLLCREVHGFGYLSTCLSRAFNIKRKDCVKCLEESNYVLTPDFAMKMININECMECKSPLVISGETGVGKTFLVEVVSKLWNLSSASSIKELQTSLLCRLIKKG